MHFWVCLQMTFIECCTELTRYTDGPPCSGWPLCPKNRIELNHKFGIRISVSTPATEPHWTPLASDAEGFLFVLRRRSALRFGDGRGFLGTRTCVGTEAGLRVRGPAPARLRLLPLPSGSGACFLLTRNERGISRLLYGVLSRESIWEGWFPYLWKRGGHTCALTAAPLVCMQVERIWSPHLTGPAMQMVLRRRGAEGTASSATLLGNPAFISRSSWLSVGFMSPKLGQKQAIQISALLLTIG